MITLHPDWTVARYSNQPESKEDSDIRVPDPVVGSAHMPATLKQSVQYHVKSSLDGTAQPQRMCGRVHVGKNEVFAGECMCVSPQLVYLNASSLSRLCGGQLPEAEALHILLIDTFSKTKTKYSSVAIHVPRVWSPTFPLLHDHALVQLNSPSPYVATAEESARNVPAEVRQIITSVSDPTSGRVAQTARKPDAAMRFVFNDVRTASISTASAVRSGGCRRSKARCKTKVPNFFIGCANKCGCPRGAVRFEGKPWKLPCNYDPVKEARIVAQSGAWSSGNAVGCLPNGLNVRLLPRTGIPKPQAADWNSSGQYYYEVKRRFAGLPVPTVLGMREKRTQVLTLPDCCAEQSIDVPPDDCDEEIVLERIAATGGLSRGAIMG